MNHSSLYVSDLDGTLLGADGKLSAYSRERLIELLEAGVHFTVASARAWDEIRLVLGDLPLRLPVIAINGAYLTDYATGRHRVINNLPPELASRVYQHILDHGLLPFVVGHDGQSDRLYWQQLISEEMQWYHDVLQQDGVKRLTHVERLDDVLSEKVIAYVVMGARETVTALWQLIESQYPGQLENFLFENPYTPGHWWLTIHDQRACKSRGIRTLTEMTSHTLENLTVFGDHINDIKMLKMAGKGVTMANAEDEVKAIADEIIGHHTEDAVVNYLMEHALR